MTGQTSVDTVNNRASSISAISALTFTPSQLEYKDRRIDRSEPSSGDEGQTNKTFHIYEDEGVEISSRPSKLSRKVDNGSRIRNSAPPRTPASPNITEAPTSPRNVEVGEIAMAGFGNPSKSGPSSPLRVTRVRGESINSAHNPGNRYRNSTTAPDGERRGSEAKSWEEVHAARREAAAAVKLVDMTSPTQELSQRTSQPHSSNSTRALKSTPLPITVPSISDIALSRYPSSSTRAIRSPHPEDDLATPTTAGISQLPSAVSLNRYPSHSTKAIKSPNDSPTSPKSARSAKSAQSAKSAKSEASATSSKRAERGLHVPFLPNLLRLTSPRTSNDTARQESEDVTPLPSSDGASRRASASSSTGRKGSGSSSGPSRRNSVPVNSGGEPLKSVFEADDSEEYDDDAEVSNATTAATGRPKIVRQRASGREVVGLKEILKEEPNASNVEVGVNNKSPTKSKVSRFFGESVKLGGKRGGIVGVPNAEEAQDVTLSHMDPISIDPTPGTPETYTDGLRSNPVKRAATAPVKRSRKVTFPPPLDTTIGTQAEREMRDVRFLDRVALMIWSD